MSSTPAFDKAWAAARDLEGWLSESQARVLFDAARQVEPGRSIVEIGSHRGRSTVVMALAAADGVEVVAVDPFDDPRWGGGSESLEAFRANLQRAGVTGRVRVFHGTSEAAARSWTGVAISLVYVDGAHDRDSVLTDIDGWAELLDQGGAMCLHDAFSSVGVTLAVIQRFLFQRRFAFVTSERTLVEFRKQDCSVFTVGGTSMRLLLQLPYFVRNLAVKVALRRGWRRACLLLGHKDDAFPY